MKRVLSLTLIISLVFGLMVTQATAVSANQVQQSLEAVLKDFPAGSYFTTNGEKGKSGELTKIMEARGLNTAGYDVSYTCVGFAKYVWAKVFNHTITPDYRVEYSSGRAGMAATWKNARIGDLVYFYKNSDLKIHKEYPKNDPRYDPYLHAAIIWAISDSGITLYDCNYKGKNQIGLYTAYFGASGWPKSYCRLYHANNYDAVSGSSTTSVPGGGTSSLTLKYWNCNTIISCFNGQTVNLYSNPGDSIRLTYFSKGQTAKSTRGATLSDDSIWYSVTVKYNGSDRLLWLKYDGNKMTYTDIEEKPVNQYSVILDNGTACRQITVTNGGTYGNLGTPTRDGYTFDGWYTRESGGTRVTSSTTVDLTSDQTLYAHWTKVAHTEHTKGDYIISSDHPHYIFYTCPVCGEVFSDGTTTSVDSCEICNPKEPVDTGHWGNWSSWSTNSVYESGTREVETRTVKVSDGYTEYRYGRYIDGTGGHVGWCATYLANKGYSGITIQYSDWTTSRYSTSGKGWTCGSCNGNHVGVDHYGSDGRAWWADYTSPRSGSFFWEESRTVGAGYETQYRYRDWISG